MKTISIAVCGLMVGFIAVGCGVQDQNHPVKTQSYHQMGDRGYNINSNSSGSAPVANKGDTTNLTQIKLNEDYDLHLSSTLEAKLNRAGITNYSVLAGSDQVLLGLSYAGQGQNQSPNKDSARWNSQGVADKQGYGTPVAPNNTQMNKGFGSPTAPQLNSSTNQINGVPVRNLEQKPNPNPINKGVNKTNQIPVNPGLGDTSRVEQSNQSNLYRAQDIIHKEMGKDVDVIVVDDPAGIEAISRIKQKLSMRGTPRAEAISGDVKILENSINR